jgi:anaerobic selenocysteine-containing dehydrogenase
LPNQEIFRRLAAAMGYEKPELFEDDTSLITNLLKQTGKAIDFAELAKRGTEEFTVEPIIQFEELLFPTPSGKIEIVSKRFEEEGLKRVPQPFAEKMSTTGRLRLLSPASPWLMNSSYGNDARIRSQIGMGDVFLNPQEASSRDIEEGMEVVLSNETGKLLLLVRFSKSVPRGVALVYKGRWPKHELTRANVNVLNSGQKTDLGQSSAVHSIEVEITPVGNNRASDFL